VYDQPASVSPAIKEQPVIKPELLEILACPKCKKKVVLVESGKFLVCEECKLRYPVNDMGIPIMLIDRAEPLES
jgi:uncharacterized protein YbaR (Trm112 family)